VLGTLNQRDPEREKGRFKRTGITGVVISSLKISIGGQKSWEAIDKDVRISLK